MKIVAYDQPSLFEELHEEWDDLLRRSATNHIFSTWEWQSTWWEAYQPGELWVLAAREDDGRLIGLAPLFIEDNADHGRMVRYIGCVDVTDYLEVIVDKDRADEVLGCLAYYLGNARRRYDRLSLCNNPEDSVSLQLFPKKLSQNGLEVSVEQQEVCPIIYLPDNFETYLDNLDKKQRHEIRRKIRRAEGAPENVGWYIVGPKHDINVELDRFLSLMAASHPEKAEFLRDPKNIAFFKSIVPLAYERGWLQLNFLTIGGVAAATYLNFDFGGCILVYNSGLLPNEYGQLSPGIVLLAHNIKHAIDTGHKVFDFLRGNESYKYRMGAVETRVYLVAAQTVPVVA